MSPPLNLRENEKAKIRAALTAYAGQVQGLLRRLADPQSLAPERIAQAKDACAELRAAMESHCRRLSEMETHGQDDGAEAAFLLPMLKEALVHLQPAADGGARLDWYVAAHCLKVEIEHHIDLLQDESDRAHPPRRPGIAQGIYPDEARRQTGLRASAGGDLRGAPRKSA